MDACAMALALLTQSSRAKNHVVMQRNAHFSKWIHVYVDWVYCLGKIIIAIFGCILVGNCIEQMPANVEPCTIWTLSTLSILLAPLRLIRVLSRSRCFSSSLNMLKLHWDHFFPTGVAKPVQHQISTFRLKFNLMCNFGKKKSEDLVAVWSGPRVELQSVWILWLDATRWMLLCGFRVTKWHLAVRILDLDTSVALICYAMSEPELPAFSLFFFFLFFFFFALATFFSGNYSIMNMRTNVLLFRYSQGCSSLSVLFFVFFTPATFGGNYRIQWAAAQMNKTTFLIFQNPKIQLSIFLFFFYARDTLLAFTL